MLFPFVTFLVVLAVIVGLYWTFILRPEEQAERSLRKRLRGVRESSIVKEAVIKEVERLSGVPLVNRVLHRTLGASSKLQQLIDGSGVKMTVGLLLLMSAFFGMLGVVVVWQYTGYLALGAAVGVIAATGPYLYLRRKRTVRFRKFEEQFPEAIDLIARAMRAGHAFNTALGMVAEEIPAPVGTEFRLLYDLQNYGMSLPDAMTRFAMRIPLIDARFFVTSVLTQREAGGNLAEVLDNLSNVIRERFRVKRQVRVISAHGRITGFVLAAFPLFLAVMFFSMSPEHMLVMITDPIGIRMVIGAAILQVIGALIIRRLVDIEY